MIEVKFTKEDEAKFEQMLALAKEAKLSDEQMPEFMALMKAKKEATQEKEANYLNVVSAIKELGVPLSFLYENGCFTSTEIVGLVKDKGMVVVGDKPARKSKESNEEKAPKTPMIVGTFDLTEYGFAGKTYTWDMNNSPRGRSENVAYVKAIKEGGVDKASKFFTEEFKSWLTETVTNTSGRYAGTPVYTNKAEFYNLFGVSINIKTGEVETTTMAEKIGKATTEEKPEVKTEEKKDSGKKTKEIKEYPAA